MKITYIFPSKSRPQKFFAALDNIKTLSVSDNYEIICVLDKDDETMCSSEVLLRLQVLPPNVKYYFGVSEGKIHACNREVNKINPETSIICLHSDDMVMTKQGFDNDIREAFTKFLPQFDGVVHFPDGHQQFTMTYTIMGINLFKKLGYLYFDGYKSVFADNDLTEMCKLMGKYVFVNKQILLHAHPIFKLTEWDNQYKESESPENYKTDGATFAKRKIENFGL